VNLSILAIVDLDELAEAARVVVVRRLGVAKSLKTGEDRAGKKI
jgi:hypothetical protein